MGASLSFCGLGPASNDGGMRPVRPPSSHSVCCSMLTVCVYVQGYDRHEFTKDLKRTPSQRLRAASSATDTSIASILSASDQLIPEAFRPVDIQVISQRRQRRPSRGASSSQATLSASALYSRGAGDVVPLSSYSGSHLLALQQSKHARGDDGEPLGGARDLVRGCA